ncbi:MAG: Tad domain-containing protein [Bacillota bacterium]|nr:Tad domain-containing protein [Bacillota bacterium]
MKRFLKSNNKGSTLIIFTFILTILLSFSAVAVDAGNTMVEKEKLQNAIDSAALAAAIELPDDQKAADVAYHYLELNGYTKDDVEISFDNDNSKISLNGKKTIPMYFAKILGIKTTTAHTFAAASLDRIGGAFNYVLFSGNPNTALTINGSYTYISGSVHSNFYFNLNGSDNTITGSAEAVKTLSVNGSNVHIGTRVQNAPFVQMPDFSETIKAQAQQYGQIYNGNKIFDGGNINVDTPIYVNGDVIINGSHFTGKGSILATGNIIFNGSNLNQSTDDAVCFYSQKGDITVNGSDAVLDGILYAPKGNITFNGLNQTIYGRAVAGTVQFNGNGLKVIGGTEELESLPSYGVKLIE